MARVLKKKTSADQPVLQPSTPGGAAEDRGPARALVKVVIVKDSARIVTVLPRHELWDRDHTTVDWFDLDVKGAFVRLSPPAEATDVMVTTLKRACELAGALAVRALPRERNMVVVQDKAKGTGEHRSIRKTVETMVEEANTKNRDALRTEVQKLLSEVGL